MTRRRTERRTGLRSAARELQALPGERLHKVLARAGQGSRRQLESRIEAGEFQVNGQDAQIGQPIVPGDLIRAGRAVWRVVEQPATPAQVLAYHKPAGEVCTRSDPQRRPRVFDKLPRLAGGRWVAVGRLDINTTGLMLFTDDGDLAHRLMHPASELDREYLVRVRGRVNDAMLTRLSTGVAVDGAVARFAELAPLGAQGSNRWFRVVVREGRYRMVRRLWESQGCQVSRLKRIRFGRVALPRELRAGEYRRLTAAEIDALEAQLNHR